MHGNKYTSPSSIPWLTSRGIDPNYTADIYKISGFLRHLSAEDYKPFIDEKIELTEKALDEAITEFEHVHSDEFDADHIKAWMLILDLVGIANKNGDYRYDIRHRHFHSVHPIWSDQDTTQWRKATGEVYKKYIGTIRTGLKVNVVEKMKADRFTLTFTTKLKQGTVVFHKGEGDSLMKCHYGPHLTTLCMIAIRQMLSMANPLNSDARIEFSGELNAWVHFMEYLQWTSPISSVKQLARSAQEMERLMTPPADIESGLGGYSEEDIKLEEPLSNDTFITTGFLERLERVMYKYTGWRNPNRRDKERA